MKKSSDIAYCSKCGRKLIELSKKVSMFGNQLAPLTTTTYKCPDLACQEVTNKKIAEFARQKAELEQKRLFKAKAMADKKLAA